MKQFSDYCRYDNSRRGGNLMLVRLTCIVQFDITHYQDRMSMSILYNSTATFSLEYHNKDESM